MLKEMIKKVGVSAFARVGIDRLAVRLHARDALVLVYHAILSEAKDEPFRYHHTIDEFEAHLDWLGANCTPVGLADFARWKLGEWQPRKPPILLTFDDGYRNNAALAAPLLIKKGFPALFFIVSGYVDGARVLWPDEVFSRVLAWTGTSLDDPNGTVLVPESQEARRTLALSVVEACKNSTDARRREFMAYLARETPQCDPLLDPGVQAFMTWNDVRALSAAGFDLGSHTVTHPILSNLEPEQLREELLESRAAIEMQTGLQCTALAYPNGLSRDFSDLVVAATAQAGYDFAFTVSNRWCLRARDPLRLDRVGSPGHRDIATFALHASGCRRWFPH
ncbi:MAG TPA: polysaccharide deacetylase family protein [Candidatus Binatus sp.]|uniref:polysaccharide deacetylase family protein n=1 Tax=Candidatus Binatus sp. TaxID=2811406 RepID=UPI002F3E615D